jgi:transposase
MNEQSCLFQSLPENSRARSEVATPADALRVLTAQRNQIALRPVDLEATVGPDHPVRNVWAFVERLDLSALYAQIGSVEGAAGRPAIDPKILMALWLYATLDGVGSAREIERLTEVHDAYRWICGGVNVNHHTLSDFRCRPVDLLDQLLTDSVAVLMHKGLAKLERVAQDGMRVRASAGAGSFRRRLRLKFWQEQARAQVQALKGEIDADPNGANRRRRAAQKRAAEERQKRVEQALEQLAQVEKQKNKKAGAKKENETEEQYKKRTEPRASSTDPEARVMKMADGGFRPAYNVQLSTTTDKQIIVGVEVNNCGSDAGQLSPMLDQVEKRYQQCPAEWLADGGFASDADIEDAHSGGTTVYAPVRHPRNSSREPYVPLPDDSEALAQWRSAWAVKRPRRFTSNAPPPLSVLTPLRAGAGSHSFWCAGLIK